MPGFLAVYRKEMADQFSSKRFMILFTLILLAGLSATYTAAQSIRSEVSAVQTARQLPALLDRNDWK